ncbi:MAG: zinc ribbon domain-containing protein [Ignavibacteriae bacterium]|nr:zinc ribbon domain-containing protein [Ignavibacteriota bacterium]
MAKARLVCSDCGAELSREDKFCRHCGARVNGPESIPVQEVERSHDTPPLPKTSRSSSPRTCEVCGHENSHSGEYCESCGARLNAPARGSVEPERPRAAGPRKGRKPKTDRRFELWQIVTGTLLAGLLIAFIYIEVNREWPTQKPNVTPTPTGTSADVLHEIEHLQETLSANPTDYASLLRLANLFHDSAREDASLFSRAIDAYKKYLSLRPDDPDARVDLGICYFELARFDSANAGRLLGMAVSEMEATFKNHPKHQAAAFNLGIVNLYSGKLEDSNRWFRKAIDLDPNSNLGKRAKQILEQHNFSAPS